MSWWKRLTDPTPDPLLDRGAAQRRMVADAPPVVAAPSPFADLAAAHIRVAELEEDLAAEIDVRRTTEQNLMDESAAHGRTLGALRRESAALTLAREQRDAARVAETLCSVTYCPRCQADVGCLPVGWWCDECTRAYPEEARSFGYRSIAERVNGLRYDKGGMYPPVTIRNLSGLLDGWSTTSGDPATTATIDAADLSMEIAGPLHIAPCLEPFGGKCTCVVGADPADTAKVGDVLGMAWLDKRTAPLCPATDGRLACTRGQHRGQHVATGAGEVLSVWPNADDRRPCAKCTDRVHTLSARDWCDWCEQDAGARECGRCEDAFEHLSERGWCKACEGQVDELTRREAVLADYDQRKRDDELIEKARALGDEVGQRIVTGDELDDLPVGTVLLNTEPDDDVPGDLHAIVRYGHGWWSCDDGQVGPTSNALRYAVLYMPGLLYVPGTAETREVRPVAGRDRTAAIEGAAITLRAHVFSPVHRDTACSCGWDALQGNHSHTPPQGEAREAMHARHVAEQLAAVGALGNHAATTPRDLIDGGDLRWRWVPGGYSRTVERPLTRHEVDVNWGPIREVEPEEVPF